jgi:hypothetical protein
VSVCVSVRVSVSECVSVCVCVLELGSDICCHPGRQGAGGGKTGRK